MWLAAVGALLLAGVLGGSLPAVAESPRLSEAWLAVESLPSSPSYAFYLRQNDAAASEARNRRLVAELSELIESLALSGERERLAGLQAWQQQLEAHRDSAEQARSPGRADVAALAASPRHDPPLSSLVHFGHCETPPWVEVWHAAGVTRLPYRAGLTASNALQQAAQATGGPGRADTAVLVTPLGAIQELGVAAWNHQIVALPPGSRLMVPTGLDTPGSDWLDANLPRHLASRLPGDACEIHPLDDDRSTTLPSQ